MWRWTATILASLAVASLQFQYGPTRKMFREKALSMLTQGNTEFASNVYQNLENGNAIFSPLSLLTALGLALSAANGTTAQEITTTLNIDPAFIGIGFRGLMKKIKGEVIHMKFANALFVQSDFPVMEEFSTRASKVFMAKVNNVDFSHNCTGAAKIINNWVKRKTRKKIKVIIPTGL
ncbi:hypothetical protein C0J52_17859 [Blattella germanica]|nr:hypothetical protein C0J52_17859 [Blattella germanica]